MGTRDRTLRRGKLKVRGLWVCVNVNPSLFLVLGLFFFIIFGCSSFTDKQSEFKHSWGETTRGLPPLLRPAKCQVSDSTDPVLSRLHKIAERIIQKNPSVFRENLSLSQICIGLNSKWDKPEARTLPEAKTITFSPQMVLIAESDDEIAAVLSHELAHITLQHHGFGEAPPRVLADPHYKNLQTQSEQLQKQIVQLALEGDRNEEIFALNAKFAQLQSQINQHIDVIYGEKNAHLNWFEQEADEVGGEFFIRAGFSPDAYLSMLWRTSSATAEERLDCEQLIEAALFKKPVVRPERGSKIHPTTCWRSYHLKVDEWAHAHAEEIDRLTPK